MDKTMEDRMIDAHEAGMAYARELDASLRAARNKAKHAYATYPEQETFVAGYIGQLRRMTLTVRWMAGSEVMSTPNREQELITLEMLKEGLEAWYTWEHNDACPKDLVRSIYLAMRRVATEVVYE